MSNSRIRRRNKCGFTGVGTNQHYNFGGTGDGTYIKPKQRNTNSHIIQMAKSVCVYGKHVGSKPISRLKKNIESTLYSLRIMK